MKLYIFHPPTRKNQQTRLAADYNAAVNSIVVKNTDGFAVNDFIVLGKIGFEQAEIVKVSAITNDTTLGLAANTKFPHARDAVVTLLGWDKIRVYRSTTGASGAFSLVATIDIEVDSEVTPYSDSAATASYYYKFAPYNSVTEVQGILSDAVASTGFVFYSKKTMIDRVLSLFGDSDGDFISREEVGDAINEMYEIAQLEASLATNRFNISTQVITTENATEDYPLNADFMIEKAVRVSSDGGTTYPYNATMKSLDSLGVVDQSNVKYGYTVYGSVLKLDDPVPANSSDKLKVYYIPTPQNLVDQTDTLQAPFVNSSHIFVKYGLASCYLKDKKVDDYKELRDEAYNSLTRHISFLKRLSNLHPQFSEIMGGGR